MTHAGDGRDCRAARAPWSAGGGVAVWCVVASRWCVGGPRPARGAPVPTSRREGRRRGQQGEQGRSRPIDRTFAPGAPFAARSLAARFRQCARRVHAPPVRRRRSSNGDKHLRSRCGFTVPFSLRALERWLRSRTVAQPPCRMICLRSAPGAVGAGSMGRTGGGRLPALVVFGGGGGVCFSRALECRCRGLCSTSRSPLPS